MTLHWPVGTLDRTPHAGQAKGRSFSSQLAEKKRTNDNLLALDLVDAEWPVTRSDCFIWNELQEDDDLDDQPISNHITDEAFAAIEECN
jgi:hypothetical protein